MTPFLLPGALHAAEPPEARGLERDEVRLLVAGPSGASVRHETFRNLAQVLRPGDLLVVNNSATIPAAVDAVRADGSLTTVHVGGELPDGSWVVEVRPAGAAEGPVGDATAGEQMLLPAPPPG